MAGTPFESVYKVFFSKITDDMYLEKTRSETEGMVQELLEAAIPWFEFPRTELSYNTETLEFVNTLTTEEINIIAMYMVVEWLGQQLADVKLTRELYSGADFKFTSQANHMQKLQSLKDNFQQKGFHLQRLYKRRRVDEHGHVRSTMNIIMAPYSPEEERA